MQKKKKQNEKTIEIEKNISNILNTKDRSLFTFTNKSIRESVDFPLTKTYD